MASAFSHVIIPAVIYAAFKSGSINIRLLVVAAALSVLPDLDVVAFKFGIPYESQWGHRGFGVFQDSCRLFSLRCDFGFWFFFLWI
ncbi:metal-dependent hydrolase [Microbulbifer sp. TB1203]|uniref:metal-dependent hydrolase n=1 Tax=unclassified Microbulbifer TaxID=2619833 RepID=UPI0035AF1F5A